MLASPVSLEETNETINYFHQQRTNGNGSLIYNALTNGNSNNIHYNINNTSTMNNNLNLILNANSHSNSISNGKTMKSLLFNPTEKDYATTESCSESLSSVDSSTVNGCIIGVGGSNNAKLLFANSSKSTLPAPAPTPSPATANQQINDKTWL